MRRSRESGVGIRESESRSRSLQTDTLQALALAAPIHGLTAPLSRRHFLGLLLGSAATLALPLQARAAGNYDFWFTRLRYDSGDWDVDARMPSNLITSLIDYTQLRVDPQEHVLDLADPRMLQAPFCYLSGHKLVEFNPAERRNFERYVRNGGFVFVDDCNHDIDGLFATSFEAQMATIFGKSALQKLPKSHRLYSAFFKFPDGPPATSFELNGWGDDLVHDYLRGISIDGRLGVLYSNKDYGCEWDYDWRNKRFLAEDNTKFAVNIVMYALTN
ncbi:DUF4159 domain-containing protein [Xanthomonas sp. BRIP62409]|uniref:DUF4159 domain-containing protein n=1 Tax=Xanthomonas sp. BRIP62409 TaxID=2182388 RepID=UPI000F8E1FCE|nr:DUF4159 domain-containing protein [Xanthomonas sp. BRIP62409]